jgi:hypothetical protein
LDIHFTVGTSCESAAPLAEKNAIARHHVLRSPISLHNEHLLFIKVKHDAMKMYAGVVLRIHNFDSRLM